MIFSSLEINGWRQYASIQIEFHPNLTILTGANGSGKTTLLNVLGRHFQWHVNFVGTPVRDRSNGTISYIADIFRRRFSLESQVHGWANVGKLIYEGGAESEIQVPEQGGQQYNINLVNQQSVSGLHIPSHRPIYSYQPVTTIPTQAMQRQQIYNEYFNTTFQRYMNGHANKAPNQVMKEALISLAVFGPGNEHVQPNDSSRLLFEGFQEVLRRVLPPKIGFRRLLIQMPEVVLETESGNFSLDAVSGGVASIIDMAWRIYTYSPEGGRFVCTIDEPENHLHPELQQSLLPNLVKTFPNVQFIIATHNPFMITAVLDSTVYVLDYNKERKVQSERLEAVNKSGTANDILRDVLGLPFTMPLWASKKLEDIVSKYAETGVSEEDLDSLEADLANAGLENFITDADGK